MIIAANQYQESFLIFFKIVEISERGKSLVASILIGVSNIIKEHEPHLIIMETTF